MRRQERSYCRVESNSNIFETKSKQPLFIDCSVRLTVHLVGIATYVQEKQCRIHEVKVKVRCYQLMD